VRDRAGEAFTTASEIVAVDGAVVRVTVDRQWLGRPEAMTTTRMAVR
jgi:hypothetical protein